MLLTLLAIVALGTNVVSGAVKHLPRATSSNYNATLTSAAPATTSLLCCYLDCFNVAQLLWYTSSVEVTVATVSTIVYQYNNTAITSYSTRFVNNTLPTGTIIRQNGGTISGVPTTIIGLNVGGYNAASTLVMGTVFTDPYGVEYTSPTPVWIYDYVTYRTSSPTLTGSTYVCPTYAVGFGGGNDIRPYPSGYYSVDPDPNFGQNNLGELFTSLPAGLKDWLVDHVPPNTKALWSDVAGCTLGFGDGIPTAHVPVNALTGSALTTTTINGNFGSVASSTTPISVLVPTTSTQAPPPTSTAIVVPPPSSTAVAPTPPSSSAVVAPVSSSAAGEISSLPPNFPLSTTAVILPPSSSVAGQSPTVAPAPPISTSAVNVPGSDLPTGSGTVPSQSPAGSSLISNSVAESPTVQSSSQIAGNPAGTTSVAPANPPGNSVTAPIITAGGTTIVGNSQSNFVIGSSTLTPGGTIIVPGSGTASPTTFVLPSTGSAVIINGVTQTVQQTTIPVAPITSIETIFTAGGSTFTENSASGFVIGSSTLTPGGTVIVPGSGTASPTTFVLPVSGSVVIINGATQNIQITSPPVATTTPILVIGGSTYTANSAGGFVIGTQTLTNGGVITQSGVTVSLATSGGTVVQASGGVTSTESLGGVIVSVGGFGTSTKTNAPAQVTANGVERRESVPWVVGGGLAAAALGVLVL